MRTRGERDGRRSHALVQGYSKEKICSRYNQLNSVTEHPIREDASSQSFSWLINWINNGCLFEIRYEFCNTCNNMLGSAFFQCSTSSGLFYLMIWFIFSLAYSILQPHGLSVGRSQLSLFQMFRKRHRQLRHMKKA